MQHDRFVIGQSMLYRSDMNRSQRTRGLDDCGDGRMKVRAVYRTVQGNKEGL